jgi:hypothetical protein
VKAVELQRVAAADTQDASPVPALVGDAVDQRDGADAGIRLALRQRAPQLHGEVVAVFRRLSLPEPAQPEPVRDLRQPPRTGSNPCPDAGAAEAQRSAGKLAHRPR